MDEIEAANTNSLNNQNDEEEEECVTELEVSLGEAAETFNLAKTVCSHGLFMMAPNHWDPFSRTFSRPLRLNLVSPDSDYTSLLVSMSHPSYLPSSLLVRVHGAPSLSPEHRKSILGQVVRMLRLSDDDVCKARDFRKIADAVADEECIWIRNFSGRVFRSPTLFEDMVKCILLCNCQWSRTLSMAKALCELQLELQNGSPILKGSTNSQQIQTNDLIPKTPAGKDRKRKLRAAKLSINLADKLLGTNLDFEADSCSTSDGAQVKIATLSPNLSLNHTAGNSYGSYKSCEASSKVCETDPLATADLKSDQETQCCQRKRICNFPSPGELANMDERFLAKRCGLGYRAGRIIKLSQGIVEGRIPLREFEEVGNGGSLSSYDKLADKLREIDGFGPFTQANVLMCMGFYHIIPSDSETVRHLKQVHTRNSTNQTVKRDIEEIYGKYEPFQFLAYWAELWHFYEQRFGKLNEIPSTDYKLITASNMRNTRSSKTKTKRTKIF